jgi:hypothetical protein
MSFLCLGSFLSLHAGRADMPRLLHAIEHHDFVALRDGLKDVELALSEKAALYNKARETFDKAEKESLLTSESKKGLFATLCVTFIFLGMIPCYPLVMILFFHDHNRKASFDDLINRIGVCWPQFFGSLAALGFCSTASFAAGYECEAGYYTNRPDYIRNFLNKYLKVRYWIGGKPVFG